MRYTGAGSVTCTHLLLGIRRERLSGQVHRSDHLLRWDVDRLITTSEVPVSVQRDTFLVLILGTHVQRTACSSGYPAAFWPAV